MRLEVSSLVTRNDGSLRKKNKVHTWKKNMSSRGPVDVAIKPRILLHAHSWTCLFLKKPPEGLTAEKELRLTE